MVCYLRIFLTANESSVLENIDQSAITEKVILRRVSEPVLLKVYGAPELLFAQYAQILNDVI